MCNSVEDLNIINKPLIIIILTILIILYYFVYFNHRWEQYVYITEEIIIIASLTSVSTQQGSISPPNPSIPTQARGKEEHRQQVNKAM